MASEKQIAANRANAKRSTGPKTTLGKLKSSRNAFRHGLSSSRQVYSQHQLEKLVKALAGKRATDDNLSAAAELAEAQLALREISSMRTKMLDAIDVQRCELRSFVSLQALDRYERYAHTRRRRAAQKLFA